MSHSKREESDLDAKSTTQEIQFTTKQELQFTTKNEQQDQIPALEWLIGIIGLALVLSSVSFLLYRSIDAVDNPTTFDIRMVHSVRTEQGYLAVVALKNSGGNSVASVKVVGELRDGNSPPIVRQFILDYLPANSSREILMLFPTPPSDVNLVFNVHSFEES